MTFAFENDLLHPEFAISAAGSLQVWPKVDGQNVQVTSASFEVLKPDGSTSVETGTITPATVALGNRSVSRLDVTIAGIAQPDEDYQASVSWVYNGKTYTDTVLFDVCFRPLGSTVALSDLLEVKPDVSDDLERLAMLLGYPSGQEGLEAAARVYGARGRLTLQMRLRARSREDDQIRPHMLIDTRGPLALVERYFTLVAIYESLGGTTEELDERNESRALRQAISGADATWGAMRVTYTAHDATDMAPIGQTHFGGAFHMERA